MEKDPVPPHTSSLGAGPWNGANLPDRDRLLQLIIDLAVVHGKVTLSSGQEADWYIDLRRLTLHHEGAPLVGRVMRQLTRDLRYDVVGGLTLGADPVATAMLHAAAAGEGFLDACVVRKTGKAHGLQRRIEGPDVAGRLAPGELAGTHTTLDGGQVTIDGAGEVYTVSADQTLLGAADATVICGNLPTLNATVYVLDQVLTPPA